METNEARGYRNRNRVLAAAARRYGIDGEQDKPVPTPKQIVKMIWSIGVLIGVVIGFAFAMICSAALVMAVIAWPLLIVLRHVVNAMGC